MTTLEDIIKERNKIIAQAEELKAKLDARGDSRMNSLAQSLAELIVENRVKNAELAKADTHFGGYYA